MDIKFWTASAPISSESVTYLELPGTRADNRNGLLHYDGFKKDLCFPRENLTAQNAETPTNNPINFGEGENSVPQNVQANNLVLENEHFPVVNQDFTGAVDVESPEGAVFERKQTRIQKLNQMFTRWYESYGNSSLSHPPVLRPCSDPIALGDLFIHKFRDEDGEQKEQIWVLEIEENTKKFFWKYVKKKGETHHPDPALKDRVLSMTALGRPSWITEATRERSKRSDSN